MVDINIFIINVRYVITFLHCAFTNFIPTFVFYFSPDCFYFCIWYPDLIILIWFIKFFSSISHNPFSIHKTCTIFPNSCSIPFLSALSKHSNAFMYSLFSHFPARVLQYSCFCFFLDNFDTPTPEVVTCKTSWLVGAWGGWAPSHFPQAVQVSLIKFIYLLHLIKWLICVRLYPHQYFYRDTIPRQAAS